jgi:hypothetical protein
MNVSELNYMRRDRAEYLALRGQFNNTVRPNFLKSLSDHPDALATFEPNDLMKLATGKVPLGGRFTTRSLLMMVAQTL